MERKQALKLKEADIYVGDQLANVAASKQQLITVSGEDEAELPTDARISFLLYQKEKVQDYKQRLDQQGVNAVIRECTELPPMMGGSSGHYWLDVPLSDLQDAGHVAKIAGMVSLNTRAIAEVFDSEMFRPTRTKIEQFIATKSTRRVGPSSEGTQRRY